jgi:rhodanese-related sulfurtransferase
MENKGGCELRRLSRVINLGFLIWLILMSKVSYAIMPLQNQQRQKALQEIYECYKKSFPEVPEVTPEEAMKQLQSGQVIFVDVRPPVERRVSKLPESISESEFWDCPDSYRGKTVIAYDTVGLRSGLFTEKLRKKNIGIANLRGGLLGWLHAGGKIYDNEGRESRRVHIYGCIWNYAPIEYESIR